ncbi:MAG: thermonuclease family protein [Sagittula sp.]|uniref:thermonuclease family protein n=1 Tax=Sagittula sp. TaxID=2038081 RepID=UPI0040582B6E
MYFEALIGLGLVLLVVVLAQRFSSGAKARSKDTHDRARKDRAVDEEWLRDRGSRPVSPVRPTVSTPRPAPPRAETPAVAECDPEPVRRVLKGKAWVVDGDTIDLAGVRLRLFGIDAPEMDHPYGIRAKRAMMALCKGQIVSASIVDEDAHGRTVAKCVLPDGRDLSAELVKKGLALDWPKFSGGCYAALETPDARRKLWLAAARQKGQMHVWEKFERQKAARRSSG